MGKIPNYLDKSLEGARRELLEYPCRRKKGVLCFVRIDSTALVWLQYSDAYFKYVVKHKSAKLFMMYAVCIKCTKDV